MKENTEEKSLQVIKYENNMFYKIKEFFKNLFNKNVNSNIEQSNEKFDSNINEDKKIFIKNLKFNVYLIELQKKLKLGQIKIKDLSDEEKNDIIEIYQKQIDDKKNKLNYINQEILFYKKRIQE